MTTLLVGFAFGLLCIAIAVRQPRLRDHVIRLLGLDANLAAQSSLGDFSRDALDRLRTDAPDLADALAQPAAVDLGDVPPEVRAEDFASVDSDDHNAVKERAFKLVRNPDVAEIVAILQSWNPARQHYGATPTEDYYERSLERALKRYQFEGQVDRQRRVMWKAEAGDSRTAVPDMILRDRVLLEVK